MPNQEVCEDLASQVAHHIEIMYPAAVNATPKTFLTSVKGCIMSHMHIALQASARETREEDARILDEMAKQYGPFQGESIGIQLKRAAERIRAGGR